MSQRTSTTRVWYVSPIRVIPGHGVPGHYTSDGYDGPSPREMPNLRGPFPTCAVAAGVAHAWAASEGKRSELYLVLVVNGHAKHCTLFDPTRQPTALA